MSYIVDIDKNDSYQLYGDYVHKSVNNTIEGFLDREKWIKTPTTPDTLTSMTSNAWEVNDFIEFIFSNLNQGFLKNNPDEAKIMFEDMSNEHYTEEKYINYFVTDINIFRICELHNETEEYLNELKKIQIDSYGNTLYEKINEILNLMKRGRNGSLIAQIPVTYFASLSYLFNAKADNRAISTFKKFYKSLLLYLEKSLKDMLGKDLYKKDNGDELNLWNAFPADGFNVDINTDINAFVNIFANSKYITSGISAVKAAFLNMTSNLGDLEFDDVKDMILQKNNFSSSEIKLLQNLFKGLALKYENDDSPVVFDETPGLFVKKIGKFGEITKDSTIRKKFIGATADITNENIINSHKIFKSRLESLKSTIWNSNSGWDLISQARGKHLKNKYLAFAKSKNSNKEINWINSLDSKNPEDVEKIINKIERLDDEDFISFRNIKKVSKDSLAKRRAFINKCKQGEAFKSKMQSIVATTLAINSIVEGVYDFASAISDLDDENVKAEKIVESIVKIGEAALTFVPPTPLGIVAQVGLRVIFTLSQEIVGHTEFSDYVFTDVENKNNKYRWNGGKEVIRFWGLWKESHRTIEDAQLLEPIKIINETKTDLYLYDGNVYFESQLQALKNKVITDIEKNNFLSYENVFYSFYGKDKLNEPGTKFNSADTAINLFLENDLNKHINTKLSIKGFLLLYANTIEDLRDNMIQFINDNLQPTYITQMPWSDASGCPMDQINPKINDFDLIKDFDDLAIHIKNGNRHDLIWYNENIKGRPTLNEKAIVAKLKEEFLNRINVKRKLVSKSSYLSNHKFFEIHPYNEISLYEITAKGKRFYYLSLYDALEKLMSPDMLNIKFEQLPAGEKTFRMINGKKFESDRELKEYIIAELIDHFLIKKEKKDDKENKNKED
ncbi:Uncharacterised protein [Mycoplasmopsis californica]|uniref:Uncharacterized protein n=1 Tax=Mycoplasmopsis equigenitalium TaxID=114883 RepID=A0ABY5J376_9BACT|nr:hypothetical protein [Mycoplasmopsis equigenitalium]UUD36986.1 hypothetical protein NPA09_00185 [Mycoplasmopsis equigenitalium]VEU69716.1 Uncharacterised protein [Mycoplasmopsis californica]